MKFIVTSSNFFVNIKIRDFVTICFRCKSMSGYPPHPFLGYPQGSTGVPTPGYPQAPTSGYPQVPPWGPVQPSGNPQYYSQVLILQYLSWRYKGCVVLKLEIEGWIYACSLHCGHLHGSRKNRPPFWLQETQLITIGQFLIHVTIGLKFGDGDGPNLCRVKSRC